MKILANFYRNDIAPYGSNFGFDDSVTIIIMAFYKNIWLGWCFQDSKTYIFVSDLKSFSLYIEINNIINLHVTFITGKYVICYISCIFRFGPPWNTWNTVALRYLEVVLMCFRQSCEAAAHEQELPGLGL